MRDYRTWLKTVRKATPWTITAHLTALDHFYGRRLGLGAPVVKRERIPQTAPESLRNRSLTQGLPGPRATVPSFTRWG